MDLVCIPLKTINFDWIGHFLMSLLVIHFSNWVEEFFIHSGKKSLTREVTCKHFFQVYDLSLHPLSSVSYRANAFNFDKVQFFFFFPAHRLSFLYHTSILSAKSKVHRFSPILPWRNFSLFCFSFFSKTEYSTFHIFIFWLLMTSYNVRHKC